jgi:hypothetical protein
MKNGVVYLRVLGTLLVCSTLHGKSFTNNNVKTKLRRGTHQLQPIRNIFIR